MRSPNLPITPTVFYCESFACLAYGWEPFLWVFTSSQAFAFVDDLPTKRVLILYTHRVALPITQQWDRGIRASLQAELKQPVTIDVEYVDSDRLGEKRRSKNGSLYCFSNITRRRPI
jgi:hypothetical protein